MPAATPPIAHDTSESRRQPGPERELPEEREGKEPGTATEREPLAPEPPAGSDAPEDEAPAGRRPST
jgi:hypothetical protein